MKKFLFTIGLLAVSFATLWGQFKYVKVDAPFSMKPIKEFILKSASNLNGNLNCSKELEHYAS